MREIYFICILVTAFLLYISFGTIGADFAGEAGIRSLLFFITYAILTVYRHHYVAMKRAVSSLFEFFLRIVVSTLSIGIPFLVIRSSGGYDEQVSIFVSIILVVLLYLMTLDFNNRIRGNIIEFFDKRARGGGDMFIAYPPKSVFDILIPVGLYLFIALILYVIN